MLCEKTPKDICTDECKSFCMGCEDLEYCIYCPLDGRPQSDQYTS